MIAETLRQDLTLRWDRMREGLKEMGMDACLLSIDVNLLYTTGHIYSGYFYLGGRSLVFRQASEWLERRAGGVYP